MSKINLKLIKEYIVNNDKSSVMKFKNLQERDLWLHNTINVFNSCTIEDLNDVAEEAELEQKSGKLLMELYSKKLSEIVKDVNVMQLSLNEVYNEMSMRIFKYRTSDKSKAIIDNIIGSSICNFLRIYSDEEILNFINNKTEYTNIICNYIMMIYEQYRNSEGKISYGINEYTFRKVSEFIKKEQEQAKANV